MRTCGPAAEVIGASADLRALIVDAKGPAFSYGGDLAAFADDLDRLPELISGWAADLNACIATLQTIDAPIVAAVQGVCAGGMVGFAASADVVLAAEDAKFVAAYAGIGFCCDAGSSAFLTRRLGPARAASSS